MSNITSKYNFKEFKKYDNSIKPVVSRRALNEGQATLYELIEKKLKSNKAITLDEAVKIYSEQVCRETYGGKPAGYVGIYDHAKEKYTYELQPLRDDELKTRSMQWLMNATGSMVMRGYLKVTPMISLGD